MIKLIVSDIDGTLVGDGQGEGSLDPAYFDVIHKLTEKGIRFMACSGRQRQSIEKLFRPVKEEILYACDGGSIVYDCRNMIYAKTLARDMAVEIYRDAAKLTECDIMVCGTKRAYCRWEDSELYRWMVEGYGYDMEAVGDDLTCIRDEIVKISIYHKNRAEELTDVWFRPKWEKRVKLTLAGKQWLDCVPEQAGKGGALTFVQERFGILPSETMVFGDNQNDMEMFALADHSYAVENAREEVRRVASGQCDNYFEKGVLKVLQKLLNCDNMTKHGNIKKI